MLLIIKLNNERICHLLLQEIAAALEGGCNIIPVMDNFQWPLPETLPDDMRPICYFNSIRYTMCMYY